MHATSEMPEPIRYMDKVLDLIALICRVLTGVALVGLTVIFVYLAINRSFFDYIPTWVEQMGFLLVMLIAFLGAAVGVHEHTHLSVVLLRNSVPRRVRNAIVVVTDLAMAGFGALMLVYGTQLTIFKWGSLIPLINLPEGLRSLPLAVCGALILLFSLGHLIRRFAGVDFRRDSIE